MFDLEQSDNLTRRILWGTVMAAAWIHMFVFLFVFTSAHLVAGLTALLISLGVLVLGVTKCTLPHEQEKVKSWPFFYKTISFVWLVVAAERFAQLARLF